MGAELLYMDIYEKLAGLQVMVRVTPKIQINKLIRYQNHIMHEPCRRPDGTSDLQDAQPCCMEHQCNQRSVLNCECLSSLLTTTTTKPIRQCSFSPNWHCHQPRLIIGIPIFPIPMMSNSACFLAMLQEGQTAGP